MKFFLFCVLALGSVALLPIAESSSQPSRVELLTTTDEILSSIQNLAKKIHRKVDEASNATMQLSLFDLVGSLNSLSFRTQYTKESLNNPRVNTEKVHQEASELENEVYNIENKLTEVEQRADREMTVDELVNEVIKKVQDLHKDTKVSLESLSNSIENGDLPTKQRDYLHIVQGLLTEIHEDMKSIGTDFDAFRNKLKILNQEDGKFLTGLLTSFESFKISILSAKSVPESENKETKLADIITVRKAIRNLASIMSEKGAKKKGVEATKEISERAVSSGRIEVQPKHIEFVGDAMTFIGESLKKLGLKEGGKVEVVANLLIDFGTFLKENAVIAAKVTTLIVQGIVYLGKAIWNFFVGRRKRDVLAQIGHQLGARRYVGYRYAMN